jgi:hypothetical protein
MCVYLPIPPVTKTEYQFRPGFPGGRRLRCQPLPLAALGSGSQAAKTDLPKNPHLACQHGSSVGARRCPPENLFVFPAAALCVEHGPSAAPRAPLLPAGCLSLSSIQLRLLVDSQLGTCVESIRLIQSASLDAVRAQLEDLARHCSSLPEDPAARKTSLVQKTFWFDISGGSPL